MCVCMWLWFSLAQVTYDESTKPFFELLASWLPGPGQKGSQQVPESDQELWPQGVQYPGPAEGQGPGPPRVRELI